MPKAVVIIPTYNEIDNISTAIEKVLNLSKNFDFETHQTCLEKGIK